MTLARLASWSGLGRVLVPLASLAAAAACKPEPLTEIMVVVRSDMTVPGDFDGFRVEVKSGNEDVAFLKEFPLSGGEYALPADLGVVPEDDDASRRITVEVHALKGGTELFSTRAKTKFVDDRVTYLDMFLAERCITLTCLPSETCRREGCVDENLEPSLQPPLGTGWPVAFGGAGIERSYDMLATSSRVVHAADYTTPFELGGVTLPQPAGIGAVVTGFDWSGRVAFAAPLAGTGLTYVKGVAPLSGDRFAAAGYFSGELSHGSITLPGLPDDQQSELMELDANGNVLALESVGRSPGRNVQTHAVAVAGDGRIAIAGVHTGGSQFGSAALVPPQTLDTFGGDDAFVAVLAADRSGIWAKSHGGPTADRSVALAWSGDELYAAGWFTGAADFNDGQSLTAVGRDGYVARLDGGGSTLTVAQVGGAGDEEVTRVAALPDGSVAAVGWTTSAQVTIGATTLAGPDRDALVTLIAQGGVVWAARLGGTGDSQATSVTGVDFQGAPAIAVGGTFAGTLDLGNQTIPSKGATDAFVALYRLDGTHVFTTRVGGPSSMAATQVAGHANGLFVSGDFAGQLPFVTRTFDALGQDAFVQQLLP